MNVPFSDEELMTRVREGSVDDLTALFDRYHTALFQFFCRLTNDRALSEDLVQEAFYRILKYRRTYQPGRSFRTWMYQIARSARADSLRKQRDEVELDEVALPAIATRDRVSERQQLALLHRSLMQLPEEKREVLVLSRYQEMKYDEIGMLLGCSTGAVKVRVHRALQQLKQTFRLEAQRTGK